VKKNYGGKSLRKNKSITFKVWIEKKGKHLLGEGGAAILEAIDKFGSMRKAAEKLGMSYKYVWDYIAAIEREFKKPVIETYRGGKKGGGGAKLTQEGKRLLLEFTRIKSKLTKTVKEAPYHGVENLKISARNRLYGTVEDIKEKDVLAVVKVKIRQPATLKVILTREAVEELNIKVGSRVAALVKATAIMLAKAR
jgi:molybdate transport system regulatory protein